MALRRRQHVHVLLGADGHRVDEVVGQLGLVLDDELGGAVNRVLIGLVNLHPKSARRKRVDVGALAERVLPDVGPGEVRLDARRGLGHQRDRAGRCNRRRLVVARRQFHVFGDADVFAQEAVVGFLVRQVLREDALLRAEAAGLCPSLAADKAHHFVHQVNRGGRAVLNL